MNIFHNKSSIKIDIYIFIILTHIRITELDINKRLLLHNYHTNNSNQVFICSRTDENVTHTLDTH